VPNGTKLEEGLLSAKEEFLHVVQFLFLVGRNTLKGCPINVLMDCGVGMAPKENPGASNQDVQNLTSRVHQLTVAVTRSNEAAEARAETTKTKSGKDKMQSSVMCMILNVLEEIDEDMVNDNGDPVPSRTDFVESYKAILECSTSGTMKQQLDY